MVRGSPRTAQQERSLDVLADALIAINSAGTLDEITAEVTTHTQTILDVVWVACRLTDGRTRDRTQGDRAGEPALSTELVSQDGSVLGTIEIGPKRQGSLLPYEQSVLVKLARIASTAIERVHLQDQLERRLEQLQGLAEAAVAVNSPLATGEVLERLTQAAAEIVGAHVAVTDYAGDGGAMHPHTAVHVSADYREAGGAPPVLPDDVVSELRTGNVSVRLTSEQVSAVRPSTDGPLPCTGILATPLVSRDGANLGLVHLCNKIDGSEFSAEDEAILEQLATLASVTVEKARLYANQAQAAAAQFRDELLAGMSHDMQTPLSVIVGIADSLMEDPSLPVEERRPIYEIVARQARRLRSLVNQFLDFSRIEADRPLTLDVQAVDVVEVIDDVVPLFTHQREVIVGADGELPMAFADRERLEQVLVNLLSNAVKYSEDAVRIVARLDAGRVVIDVVDEGPGMSEGELEQIFEKFQRGSSANGTRGTGLGLYISRALTEAQGGTLTASSRSGLGSRFRVSLEPAPPER